MLAMKFNDDSWFSNTYNALVSGLDKEELLYLEVNFLKLIDFKLKVDSKTFESYYNHLVETSERKAVLRNWSWLDPAHSYKVFSKMVKAKKEKSAEKLTKELSRRSSRLEGIDLNDWEMENRIVPNSTKHKSSSESVFEYSQKSSDSQQKIGKSKNHEVSNTDVTRNSSEMTRHSVSHHFGNENNLSKINSSNKTNSYPTSVPVCREESESRSTNQYPACKFNTYHTTHHFNMESHRVSF
jgi:hypothetical protein